MAVQFFIGGSGSGKSQEMYTRITKEAAAHPRKKYLLLVPEQFTLQTQRRLVELSPHGVIANIDVLSFVRLAYRVFDELGFSGKEILDDVGKSMLISQTAKEEEEHLSALRPNLGKMGYVQQLRSLICELMEYRIGCEDLDAYLQKEKETLPPVLYAKLSDVSVLYRAYINRLHERGMASEELLPTLTRLAKDSDLLRGAVLTLDEYTGFTPAQYELIEELMVICDRIDLTFSMDADEDLFGPYFEHELFALPKETLQKITEAARRQGVPLLDPVLLFGAEEKRYAGSPDLYYLSRHLFRGGTKDPLAMHQPPAIKINSCLNPKEELLLAAREIKSLVRTCGLRYQQIAVVTSDPQTFGRYVPEVFSQYEIPVFSDEAETILFHPYWEMIRAAVEVVRQDFSYDALLRFLRCGFFDLTPEEIDRLDNYLLATGLCGRSALKRPFVQKQKGVELNEEQLLDLEETRRSLMAVLDPFAGSFGKLDASVKSRTNALCELLDSLHAKEKLQEKSKRALAEGDQVKSSEYAQMDGIVSGIFDQMISILGGQHLSVEDYAYLLDSAFFSASVAALPPGYDCVTIGDIERTRLLDISVLFFLGVNDTLVPKEADGGGVVSSYERQWLRQHDLPLAPGVREQSIRGRYYLYLLLGKPKDKLYLSYFRTDSTGQAANPSYLIDTIRSLFSGLFVREVSSVLKTPDLSTESAAFDYLLFGEHDDLYAALSAVFLSHENPRLRQLSRQILSAEEQEYRPRPLSPQTASSLYGTPLCGSVTRLETYGRCPYCHFLTYGLRLLDRREANLSGSDIGTLYHEAFGRYGEQLRCGPYDWNSVPDDALERMAKEAFFETIAAYGEENLPRKAQTLAYLSQMEHIFSESVWAVTQQVRCGSFVPSAFELPFYGYRGRLFAKPALFSLNGRIDRIDLYEKDGIWYAKIVDYKSGLKQFDPAEIYSGTQLQLLLYQNAALDYLKKKKGIDAQPAGVLYCHIDEPELTQEGPTDEASLLRQKRKAYLPNGLVRSEEDILSAMDADFTKDSLAVPVTRRADGTLTVSSSAVGEESFRILLDYADLIMQRSARGILSGDIAIRPVKKADGTLCCTFCPYASVCARDGKIKGYTFRTPLKGKKREEIISLMKEQIDLAKEEEEKRAKEEKSSTRGMKKEKNTAAEEENISLKEQSIEKEPAEEESKKSQKEQL